MSDAETDAHPRLESTGTGSPGPGERTRLLYAVSGGFGTIGLGLLCMSPLLPAIIADLEVTAFQAGLGLSIMWGLNAIGQYPGGRISDETGRKTVLVVALLGFVAGFAVVVASSTFLGYLIGVAVVGICSGAYPATGYTYLSELYSHRRGKAFGIYTGLWDVGGGVSAGVAAAAISLGEWRLAFPPIAVLAVLVASLIHRWSAEPYAFVRVSFDFRETVRRTLATREIVALVVAYCLFMIVWQGSVGFLPTFLQHERGLSSGVAATAFASLFAVGMVAKPVAGHLADRFGHLRLSLCSLALGVAGLCVVSVAGSTPVLLAGVVVFAAGLMSFTPPMLAHVTSLLPDVRAGGDLGAFRTVYMSVGSLGSTYVGFVADATSYSVAFAGLLVALFACAALVLLVFRRG
ncbi:MFS transporter [Natrialbaceae archaeon GCM10025810]|uniref:MFS transporter n=1 Tax=Halovalidus salilacus TaxID=3075124 RepID=UPI00360D2D18